MRTGFIALILYGCAAAAPALAAPLPSEARAEIGALLDRLASSHCRFNRNGTWYDGGEARSHLQRKLDYLADKEAIGSTEQFIELAATKSSMSGAAYLVSCADSQAVPSSAWLSAELRALRASRLSRPPRQQAAQ